MIPKRIAVKNFLSFGEMPGGKPVEFIFPNGDDRLWVMCGPNGTGKSAVFDAITYALFGEHRGGRHKVEQLIRHNANGFEVEVDFEFNGVDYQVRRTKPRTGHTTQHVKQLVDGEWQPIRVNDNKGAVTAKDIDRWVIDTLGLNFGSFTNSVLLQQGKADKLFTAGREDRLDVLKGIIGFQQYEALSARINAAAKDAARKEEQWLDQLNAIEPVADEAVDEATRLLRETETEAAKAQDELRRATERVTQAILWEKLNGERTGLDVLLAEADRRRADGEDIRRNKNRLDELTAVVPVLQSLIGLRSKLAELEMESATARKDAEAKTKDRDEAIRAAETARSHALEHQAEAEKHSAAVKSLTEEVKRLRNYLAEAEEIARLDRRLAQEFPADLDSQHDAGRQAEINAAEAFQQAATGMTRAETHLVQAKEQQERFADVKVGAKCLHCRQPVNEGHAVEIRKELVAETKRRHDEFGTAKAEAQKTEKELAAVRKRLTSIEQQRSERDKLLVQREARSDSLKLHEVAGSAESLHAQILEKEKQRADADAKQKERAGLAATAIQEAQQHEVARKKLDGQVRTVEAAAREKESALDTTRGQQQVRFAQLMPEWKDRLQGLYQEQVSVLARELDRLTAAGVAGQFQKLEDDEAKRSVWVDRVKQLEVEVGKIPGVDRIPEAAARQQQVEAESTASTRDSARTAAITSLNELAARRHRRKELTEQHRQAAEDQRLLARLDKLLGETGLQRELVREAEEAVIAFANDTLHELSGGDLALEEDTSQDSTKTFDLRARRAGGEPIGVAFLSGSQRFRVAVSIALAVGRFAGGRARPLESVIIDEGFGSLDPEGLEAMAKELKQLQEAKSLERVILVSHQPEFTNQFPVGYTLTPGENGTTATAFRR